MSNENHIDSRLEQALDIVDAHTDISDEQLALLQADADLRADVQQLLGMRAALKAQQHPADVEGRLKRFKASHPSPLTSHLSPFTSYLLPLLAAAAFIGALLVLWPTAQPTPPLQDGPQRAVVFQAPAEAAGVSLTSAKGEQVALSPQASQNSSLTLDDFRQVFAHPETTEHMTLDVPYGKSADITLPDGSVAYLHPGSRVVFPTRFTGSQRVVQLEGQAYFKVAHDAGHPFVVMTDQLETTVLGTEFHMDTRQGSVVLVSGSVSVQATTGGQSVTLQPGQQATLTSDNTRRLSVESVDTEPYRYWRDGYLYFDNVELRDIMLAIGQNFNMTVEFASQEALHYRMRFITERNSGVDAALETMNRMKKVQVQRNGNHILVN